MIVKLKVDRNGPSGPMPAGTEIDHADGWRLMLLGIADPVDDEAKAKRVALDEISQRRGARKPPGIPAVPAAE